MKTIGCATSSYITPFVGGPMGRRPTVPLLVPMLLLPPLPAVPFAVTPLELVPVPFVAPVPAAPPPDDGDVPCALTLVTPTPFEGPLAVLSPLAFPPDVAALAFGPWAPWAAELPPAIEFGVLSENLSSFAMMCLPYVYFFSEFMCGRILCNSTLRCVGSDTSIIFCTT
uniref:Uncharacterized protein n=1 Tax=Anopheles atroparvus TaxID=41427 RepID=A0A182JIW0_ANOAO